MFQGYCGCSVFIRTPPSSYSHAVGCFLIRSIWFPLPSLCFHLTADLSPHDSNQGQFLPEVRLSSSQAPPDGGGLWRRKKYFASTPDIRLKIYSHCSKQLVLRGDYTQMLGQGWAVHLFTGHANKLISVSLNINLIFFFF